MGIDARELGTRIRDARKRKGLSQIDLAGEVGISVTHMGNIETGKKDFSVDIFMRIVEALSCSADDLLGTGVEHSASQYEQKLYNILEGCNDKEKEIILDSVKNLKTVFSNRRR